MAQFVYRLWLRLLPVQLILIVGMVGLIVGVTAAFSLSLLRGDVVPLPPGYSPPPTPVPLGQVFTPQVQHWRANIEKWAREYGLDPNLVATVMQIESCGDFMAGSGAGALGLFQVMPFHFTDSEDAHDPDTNARRGLEYLKDSLVQADGHAGLALAGYNGGHGVIDVGWGEWSAETRIYYLWGTGIYLDAIHGKTTAQSETLQEWLNAGGINLCNQASARIVGTMTIPAPTPH
ncbi:MAG TPA: transglycosylase SLT domain-containing protein [Aggregatilineaceae bacterium]|nr:transglycosylase SLT domain-containing protein [Aggregatilineaceae bacterium]